MELNQVTIPCAVYEDSVRFYKTLGLRLIVDSPPDYARFETASGTTLSIHRAEPGAACSAVRLYFEVDDVDLEVRNLKHQGISFEREPVDQAWLWREAHLEDPAGNRICIYHAGKNRRHPPWRVN